MALLSCAMNLKDWSGFVRSLEEENQNKMGVWNRGHRGFFTLSITLSSSLRVLVVVVVVLVVVVSFYSHIQLLFNLFYECGCGGGDGSGVFFCEGGGGG